MNPADLFLPVVRKWILEYAFKFRMLHVLQNLPREDFPGCGVACVRLSLCVVENVSKKLDECSSSDLEMAVAIAEKLYAQADDVIPFKLYQKIVMALKVLLLFNMLENSEKGVFERCMNLMPRHGIDHPNASVKLKEYYTNKMRDFRKMFLPLLASDEAWQSFQATAQPQINLYGIEFRTKLQGLINTFVMKVEDTLQLTVIEQLLRGRSGKLEGCDVTNVRSVSMTLLVDYICGKSVLGKEDVLELMAGLWPGVVMGKKTQDMGYILESQASEALQESSLVVDGDGTVEMEKGKHFVLPPHKRKSSEEIVEGTPDGPEDKRFSIYCKPPNRRQETSHLCTSPDSTVSSDNGANTRLGNITQSVESHQSPKRKNDASPQRRKKRKPSNHQEAYVDFLHGKGISVNVSDPQRSCRHGKASPAETPQPRTVVSPLSFDMDSYERVASQESQSGKGPSIDCEPVEGDPAEQLGAVTSSCPESSVTDTSQPVNSSQESGSFLTCSSQPQCQAETGVTVTPVLIEDDDIGQQVISPIKATAPPTRVACNAEVNDMDTSFSLSCSPPRECSCHSDWPHPSNSPEGHGDYDTSSIVDDSYSDSQEELGDIFVSNDNDMSPVVPSSFSFDKFDAICGPPYSLLRASLPALSKHLRPQGTIPCIVKLFQQDVTHEGYAIYS